MSRTHEIIQRDYREISRAYYQVPLDRVHGGCGATAIALEIRRGEAPVVTCAGCGAARPDVPVLWRYGASSRHIVVGP